MHKTGADILPNGPVTYALTVFNKARFLPAVLDSVFAERAATGGTVIALDDASTDDSLAILNAWESQGLRIVRFAENRGVMAATAALIEAAEDPCLRLVDADDVLVPGSTAALRQALAASDAVLAFGRATGGSGAGQTERMARPVRMMLERQVFNPSMVLLPTAMAKTLLPLPVDIRTAQDFWLGLRLALIGDFLSCPIEAAGVAEDPQGLSRRKARVFGDTCRLLALARPFLSAGDARYALRRNAARAVRYFRRDAPGLLATGERWRLRAAAFGFSGAASASAFEALAALYERADARG